MPILTIRLTGEAMDVEPPLKLKIQKGLSTVWTKQISMVPAEVSVSLPAGDYVIILRHPQFRPKVVPVTLDRNKTVTIKVEPAIFLSSLFVLAPNIDIATALSGYTAESVVDALRKMRVKFDALFGLNANRLRLELYMRASDYDAVYYFGHGLATSWFGVSGVLLTKDNVDLLEGKVVYALACYTAKKLGRMAVSKGARAYLGFTEKVYVAFPESEHDYLKDFIRLWASPPILLADGWSTGRVYSYVTSESDKLVKLYEEKYRSGEWPNADWYAEAFRWNRSHFVLLGGSSEYVNVEFEKGKRVDVAVLLASIPLIAGGLYYLYRRGG